MEQEPRICPLCGSPVRLFFINFSEKLLMCEDPNCDFPFGYEELQIVTDESELRENFETASSISLGPYNGMSTATSVISTAAWSDIERLNRIYDSEDSMVDSRLSFTSDTVKKQRERRKTQEEIQKNLDYIKKLNTELNLLKNADRGCIEKDDWLQNLMSLQGLSGRQLLKENEIEKLKKKEPDFGMGELKININSVPNDNGLINIEIINEDNESHNKNDCGDIQENKIQIQFDEINDMDENCYISDQEENQNDKKIYLAHNKKAITLNEAINTDSSDEIENQMNNDINFERISSNDTLSELNINFNEINNFVTDSEIDYDDTNLVDVKTIVINNNRFTLIELKGAVQDINSQNETENIEGDIQIDSANATVDTSIPANKLNEENVKKQIMSGQKEIENTQNHDTIINNLTEANEENTISTISNEKPILDNSLNNNCLENRKVEETTELETSAINKEINLLLEIDKLQFNYEKNRTSNIIKTNTTADPKIRDSSTKNEINKKSGECEKEQNQDDTLIGSPIEIPNSIKSNLMNNSKKTVIMNSSEDEEDIINNFKESDLVNNSKKSDLMNGSKDQEDMIINSEESDLVNNSKKSDFMNSSKDQEDMMCNSKESDLMNNSKESKGEVKIPKKRGRPKKGTRLLEQPIRRSSRLSK